MAHILYQVGGPLSVHELLVRIHAANAAWRLGELLGREVPFGVIVLARRSGRASTGSHRRWLLVVPGFAFLPTAGRPRLRQCCSGACQRKTVEPQAANGNLPGTDAAAAAAAAATE